MPQKVMALAQIGHHQVVLNAFDTARKGYGSVGTASVELSIKMLRRSGLGSLPTLLRESQATAANENSPSLPLRVKVSLDGGKTFAIVFGGDIDTDEYAFHVDHCRIRARDWAGRLADEHTLLTSAQVQNLNPLQLAQRMAQQYGLQYAGPTPPTSEKNPDGSINPLAAPIGHLTVAGGGILALKTPMPKPAWATLVGIARAAGAQVYVTPDMKLVIRPIGERPDGTPSRQLIIGWRWAGGNPLTPANAPKTMSLGGSKVAVTPAMNPVVVHQPRRNTTFQVIVVSYHAKKRQVVTETVSVIGQPLAMPKAQTLSAGIYRGTGGAGTGSAMATATQGKPVYVLYMPESNQGQVTRAAEALARDLSKRLVTVSAVVQGDPTLSLEDNVYFVTGDPGGLVGFEGLGPYSIVAIRHEFRADGAEGGTASGYLTHITAQNIPPGVSLASANLLEGS